MVETIVDQDPALAAQTGRRVVMISLALLMGVVLAYSNHFHNAFHFDDSHTIVDRTIQRLMCAQIFPSTS